MVPHSGVVYLCNMYLIPPGGLKNAPKIDYVDVNAAVDDGWLVD